MLGEALRGERNVARAAGREDVEMLLRGDGEALERLARLQAEEAPTLTEALAPFNAAPPSPAFMARYGVYVVPAAFKERMPEAYTRLQRALIEARRDPEFDGYVERNGLRDLSLGRPGEDFTAAFAADLAEYSRLR